MYDYSVLIPYASDDPHRQRIFEWIQLRWSMLLNDSNVEVIIGSNDGVFSRSKSRNELARKASSNCLVFADADTVPIVRFVESAVKVAKRSSWCIAYGEKAYYNLTADRTLQVLDMLPDVDLDEPAPGDYEFKITSWAGMFAIDKEDFWRIGGYDERFVGWGHEDVAFMIKADYMLGKHQRVDSGFAMHLWHSRENATFDTAEEKKNRRLFENEYRRKYGWVDKR